MSFSTFDERTGNLYAIHEGGGPEEDIVSRWIPAPDYSSISREQGISAFQSTVLLGYCDTVGTRNICHNKRMSQ